MNCSSCFTELSDTAKFCPECGKVVIRSIVCQFCGTEVPVTANFCSECGNKIDNESDKESTMSVAMLAKIPDSIVFNPPLPFSRPPQKRTYLRAPFDGSHRVRSNDFYKRKYSLLFLKDQIYRIVKYESPIAEKLLFKRVLEEWGFEKATEKEFEVVRKSIPKDILVTHHIGGNTYWSADANPSEWYAYRVPENTDRSPVRVFDEIPFEEISAAVAAQRIEMQGVGDPFPGAIVRLGLDQDVTPEMKPILDDALYGPGSPKRNNTIE